MGPFHIKKKNTNTADELMGPKLTREPCVTIIDSPDKKDNISMPDHGNHHATMHFQSAKLASDMAGPKKPL